MSLAVHLVNAPQAGVRDAYLDAWREIDARGLRHPSGRRLHLAWTVHDVLHVVDVWDSPEQQQDGELDFIIGMIKSAPGFVRGTWMGDDERGLSCILFDSEQAARAVADNASLPPDASATLRSVDVYAVARDV